MSRFNHIGFDKIDILRISTKCHLYSYFRSSVLLFLDVLSVASIFYGAIRGNSLKTREKYLD